MEGGAKLVFDSPVIAIALTFITSMNAAIFLE